MGIEDYTRGPEWSDYEDRCVRRVQDELKILDMPFQKPRMHEDIIQDMSASVLAASIDYDVSRYSTMYEVLKIIEDRSFWEDVVEMYTMETGDQVPFTTDEALLRHAEAVEKVYKRHGLHNMEALLLEDLP